MSRENWSYLEVGFINGGFILTNLLCKELGGQKRFHFCTNQFQFNIFCQKMNIMKW